MVIAGQGGGKDSMLAMKGLLRLAQAGCHVDAGIVAQEQGKTMKEGKRKREKAERQGATLAFPDAPRRLESSWPYMKKGRFGAAPSGLRIPCCIPY